MLSAPRLVPGLLSLVLLTCSSSGGEAVGSGEPTVAPRASVPAGTTLEGVWGGDGIRLTLTGASGTLEFDCGGAVIDKLEVSRTGRRFRGSGRARAAAGGPATYPPRPGREPRALRFRGRLQGNELRLAIVRPRPRRSDEERKSVYRLEAGHPGQLRKCL